MFIYTKFEIINMFLLETQKYKQAYALILAGQVLFLFSLRVNTK